MVYKFIRFKYWFFVWDALMKMDGRSLSHESSETIRLMAVRRVKEGVRPSSVMESFGLCRTTIYRWLRAEKKGGEPALRARHHLGPTPILNSKEQRQIQKWMCGKDPRYYSFETGLWTRKIVVDLIRKKLRKKISISSVGRVLARLGITPQKPLRRAYERDPHAIEKWKSQDYPKIKARARRYSANIFFLDEAGIKSDAPLQRTWSQKGKTPIVATSGKRQAVSAISAINPLGAFWYDSYTERLKAVTFIEFLKAFLRTRRKLVFLIVDGHPVHKAGLVKNFLEARKKKIEMYFLPGYAPELNPDEFVWNHVRQIGVSKNPLKRNESLQKRITQDLSRIQSNKSLVRSFFYAKSVAYTMN